jgi:DNA-directed RNA polymerase subunit alpha
MRLHLSVSGQGVVTAGDIVCPPEIEIVNPELYLFTVDDPDAELDIEMTVETGRGYSPSEERGKLPIGELPVDAVFSPIRKANYDVTPARVGQMTNYDSLTLEIWTDGTLRPQKALAISAELLIKHLTLFAGVEALEAPPELAAVGEAGQVGVATIGPGADVGRGAPRTGPGAAESHAYDVPIEELDLTVRVYNCLKRTGITKVGEVLDKMEKGPDEMLAIRNFGAKSLEELRSKLIEKGYLPDEDVVGEGEAAAEPEE